MPRDGVASEKSIICRRSLNCFLAMRQSVSYNAADLDGELTGKPLRTKFEIHSTEAYAERFPHRIT